VANLTIVIDDDLLKRARIRALEQGTSVNALLRAHLEAFADSGAEASLRREVAGLARASTARSGHAGRSWRRDDLYENDRV